MSLHITDFCLIVATIQKQFSYVPSHNVTAMAMYTSIVLPYSGYNLRGAIFANHQISYLAVIFTIIKFANHCMYRVTFCVARSIYAPVAYRYFDYKRRL